MKFSLISKNIFYLIVICLYMESFCQSSYDARQVNFLNSSQSGVKAIGKSLVEVYQAAILRSETISIQQELFFQNQENFTQARNALLPSISTTMNTLKQASPQNSTGAVMSPQNQNTVRLTLSQPLFRGFREFATLRQKKDLKSSQAHELLNAARLLFYDVATAYYNVLMYSADVKNYQIEIKMNNARLDELNRFYKIGRSQLTDVLTFKSNILSLESQLEMSKGQLETAKDILAYYTGWDRETTLNDEESYEKTIYPVDFYLNSIENRPDVKTAVFNFEANHESVAIARGQYFPSIDFISNYYPVRPGALADVNWDMQLALTMPIFDEGTIQSQIRQARSVARQFSLVLSQAKRMAEQEIRTFHDAVIFDQKKYQKLKDLVVVSEKNFNTEVAYFKNGLVTNLDVLQALSTYQDAKRQVEEQKYLIQLDTVKLEGAIGGRKEINIKNKYE